MILIRKSSSLPLVRLAGASKNSILLSPSNLLTSLYLFTSKSDDPYLQTPFIVKYLIDSVGLSSSEAVKSSRFLTHIKTPSKPDSVLKFFRNNGFTDADIKTIIRRHSRVLRSTVDSTLKPKFEVLRDLGFSDTQITKLITANPRILPHLSYSNVRPRIEFLNAFLGSNDDLVKAFSRNIYLLSSSLEKRIKPNIAFLKECQFSDERISILLINGGRTIGRSLNSLKFIVKRVEKLGVPQESGMFYPAFRSFCSVSSDMVETKIRLLCSLGFSRSDLSSAFVKYPFIFCFSEKNLRDTVDFLVKEAGCTHSYVSRYPIIMTFSLTNRLIPRNYVMQLIIKKGLLKKKIGFYKVISISEKKFLEKFIFSFQERMPELLDVYLSASAGKFLC